MGSLWRSLRRLADGFTPSSCMAVYIWKFSCLRDLQVPAPCHVALLSERLSLPLKIINKDDVEKAQESCGACVPSNIREGIWIAGTMQTLEARQIELFLCEGFGNGSWNYELIGSYTINKSVGAASGGIFDLKHIKDRAMAGVFSFKSRAGQTSDLQPKAINTFHSVAIRTNLQENQGRASQAPCNQNFHNLALLHVAIHDNNRNHFNYIPASALSDFTDFQGN
ncbi:hypothetical protein H0E87_005051 [Populus deltoides]|uniref:Uncharacterized protein n=1 Tax=Populus deltoides TaxID=3696 RepID=A0A8T2ZJC0_POPDE|nr:hypothetical protein H0E87_005051 [Populus deltoides]